MMPGGLTRFTRCTFLVLALVLVIGPSFWATLTDYDYEGDDEDDSEKPSNMPVIIAQVLLLDAPLSHQPGWLPFQGPITIDSGNCSGRIGARIAKGWALISRWS